MEQRPSHGKSDLPCKRARAVESVVAIDALAPLVALLGLDRQRRDRPGVEPLQADRLAGFLAIAVGAVLDPLERRVDLGDQLALAVAGAELDRAVGFGRGAVGEVGMVLAFVLKVLKRFARLLQDFFLPGAAASRGNTRAGARS